MTKILLSLIFKFEKLYSKRVPVKACLSLSFAPQYKLVDSIKYNPESVIISGAKKSIDTMNVIHTLPLSLSKLNKDQNVILSFPENYKKAKITVSPQLVKINVNVEKYTETTLDVPVEMKNTKNNLKVRFFPEKVIIPFTLLESITKNSGSSLMVVCIGTIFLNTKFGIFSPF